MKSLPKMHLMTSRAGDPGSSRHTGMANVLWDATRKAFVATNGKSLAVVPWPADGMPQEDRQIPRTVFEQGGKAKTRVSFNGSIQISSTNGASFSFEYDSSSSFPPFDAILPKADRPIRIKIGLNAKSLLDLARTLSQETDCVYLEIENEDKVIRVTSEEKGSGFGLLMPLVKN